MWSHKIVNGCPSADQRCSTFRCWAISGFKRMDEVRSLCNQGSSWFSDWILRTCFTCLEPQQSTDGVGTLVQTDCQFVQWKVTDLRGSTSVDGFRTTGCTSDCHLVSASGDLECKAWLSSHNMGVSINGGNSKWRIYNGISNVPLRWMIWGTPIYGNLHSFALSHFAYVWLVCLACPPRMLDAEQFEKMTCDVYGGFHTWGYPNSWMVYKGKS